MRRLHSTIKQRLRRVPKKIRFEWELPDGLVDQFSQDESEMIETIKTAAVLDWVRTHKLSLRRGAELFQLPYQAFLELMAVHRVPSLDYEAGWLDREQRLFEGV